jgi:chaperonin GroEL (HSP60 family)
MSITASPIFGRGTRRSNGNQSRRYNFLAAKLIAELVKSSLGPGGLEKMFVDILGEVTVTKDGATLLRKLDVDHPAAKMLIDASNTVDNEVGDGTTSVVVLAGALIEKAEELLDIGISVASIIDGFLFGLQISLDNLNSISFELNNRDRFTMEKIAKTVLGSKSINHIIVTDNDTNFEEILVDAIFAVADFSNKCVVVDDIKIEQKIGNASEIQLISGTVIDKTIDNSSMPKSVNEAKILLIDVELDKQMTRTDAEIQLNSPYQISVFQQEQSVLLLDKIQKIIDSRANVVISRKGIGNAAQGYLTKASIMSIRRVKENDLRWIEKATGARLTRELDKISEQTLGYATKVYEKTVGEDKMVFVEGCKKPRSVTVLLRANSPKYLDEFHRSVLDALFTLRNFVLKPHIVPGGGAVEMAIAKRISDEAKSMSGSQQIVLNKFSDALQEIPRTIARNAGMNVTDILTELRSKYSNQNTEHREGIKWYGIDANERKISEMFSCNVVELSLVKEQILKTAVEVVSMLIRIDDVLINKPIKSTHTHIDGTTHSHKDGDRKHDHYFDRLGKQQRPAHHYY